MYRQAVYPGVRLASPPSSPFFIPRAIRRKEAIRHRVAIDSVLQYFGGPFCRTQDGWIVNFSRGAVQSGAVCTCDRSAACPVCVDIPPYVYYFPRPVCVRSLHPLAGCSKRASIDRCVRAMLDERSNFHTRRAQGIHREFVSRRTRRPRIRMQHRISVHTGCPANNRSKIWKLAMPKDFERGVIRSHGSG